MYLANAAAFKRLAALRGGDNVAIGICNVGTLTVAYTGVLRDVVSDVGTVALVWYIARPGSPGMYHTVRFVAVSGDIQGDGITVATV